MDLRLRAFSLLLALACARLAAAEVTVVATYPANGEKNVDPRTKVMRVRFSEPIQQGGISFVNCDKGKPIPFVLPVAYEDSDRVILIGMKLQPSTKYAVFINSEQYQNFRAAAPPNTPVTPYAIVFTTGKAGTPAKPAPKKPAPGKRAPIKPAKAATRAEKWRTDLDVLARELPARHVNPFTVLPRETFAAEVSRLRREAATADDAADDAAMEAGIARLVASLGDPHTTADVFNNERARYLPVQWHPFSDASVIIAATEPYAGLLGGRVLSLGDLPIAEAEARMAVFIPHDNDAVLLQNMPSFLRHAGLLKAAGITKDAGKVWIKVAMADGKTVESTLVSLPRRELFGEKPRTWVVPGKVDNLSWKHRADAYAVDSADGGKALYFMYNRCAEDPAKPLGPFLASLQERMKAPEVDRLIIDLRQNGGGNSALLDPFIDTLRADARLNQRGHLFVLIGRNTFSSAAMNAARLKAETNATFVGEPTGGSASHFGEVKTFTLPASGLVISYSTKRFEHPDLPQGSLLPDISAGMSSQDYAAGRDPALQACLKS